MNRKNHAALVLGVLALLAVIGGAVSSVGQSFARESSAQPISPEAHGAAESHGEDEAEHAQGEHGEEGGHEEEGDLKLTADQINAAGIEVVMAAARPMRTSVSFPGEIRFDEDRTSHIVPQLAGFVEKVNANLGETVRKGQVLAVIASQDISQQRSDLNAASKRLELARVTLGREKALWEEKISPEQDYLQARQAYQEAEIEVANAKQKVSALGGNTATAGGNRYELRAPFDGVIVEKHLGQGERVDSTTTAFVLSDLKQVWATFNVPPSELEKVILGREVTVNAPDLQTQVQGKVGYVGNLLGEQNRAAQVRVTLTNPQGAWRPGLFVNVLVAAQEATAPVSVPEAALQSVEDRPTLFVRTDEGFTARTVDIGRRDGGYLEVLKGLEAGEHVAANGSFILKSELGKASAEHSH